MACEQKVDDLSGAGVTPPLPLSLYRSSSVHGWEGYPDHYCSTAVPFSSNALSPLHVTPFTHVACLASPFQFRAERASACKIAYDDMLHSLLISAVFISNTDFRLFSHFIFSIALRHELRVRPNCTFDACAAWSWLASTAKISLLSLPLLLVFNQSDMVF